MTTRDDFTDEEWFRLRSAPWQVAMGVIEVDAHGSFATGRELRAAEAAFGRAGEGAEADLVRLVARAVADEDDEDTGTAPDDGEITGTMPERVLQAMGPLVELLEAKVDATEGAAYRAWLLDVATVTANAAKEGVGGVAGRTVSTVEQDYLDRLRDVLAPPG
jgi:hypothetical protein